MLDETTKSRFEKAIATSQLKELVHELTAEGVSQVAIYTLFLSFGELVSESNRKSDEDTLDDALESIVGHCAQGSKWFDHYLSGDEIHAYQSQLTEKEVQEVSGLILKMTEDQFFTGIKRELNGDITAKTLRIRNGAASHETTFTIQKKEGGLGCLEPKGESIA